MVHGNGVFVVGLCCLLLSLCNLWQKRKETNVTCKDLRQPSVTVIGGHKVRCYSVVHRKDRLHRKTSKLYQVVLQGNLTTRNPKAIRKFLIEMTNVFAVYTKESLI